MKWINLYVNSVCNLTCKYCYYQNKPGKPYIEYQLDYLFDLIMSEREKIIICFTGGEPTLSPKLLETLIDRLQDRCFFVLQTNGTLLHTLPIELIQSFHHIRISIDGNREYMEQVRGIGTFDKLMENVIKIKHKCDIPLLARMTLSQPGGFLDGIRTIIASKLFAHVYWQLDNDLGGKLPEKFYDSYSLELPAVLDMWIQSLNEGQFINAIPFLGVYSLLKTEFIRKNETWYYHCGPGRTMIAIDTKGIIYSCPEGVSRSGKDGNPSDVIGHISDGKFVVSPHQAKKICLKCSIRHLCGGRCIWTYHPMYCHSTRLLVNLVRSHFEKLDSLIPRNTLKESLNAVNWTEVIP